MARQHNSRFVISAQSNADCSLPFVVQPIMSLGSGTLFGFEILFRGIEPKRWSVIDSSLMAFLREFGHTDVPVFVNVANETLIQASEQEFLVSSAAANVYFELSEAAIDAKSFDVVARKVNALAAQGVRWVIDDFGSGLDGLMRVHSIERVSAIKIDGALLRQASAHANAAKSLRALVRVWKDAGIPLIGEGVEEAHHLQFAKSLALDMVQGYLIDDMLVSARSPFDPIPSLRVVAGVNRAVRPFAPALQVK